MHAAAECGFHHGLLGDDRGQYKAPIVVGVVAQQIDPTGRARPDRRRDAEDLQKTPPGFHNRTPRRWAAALSGVMSLANTPAPSSVPARNLSLFAGRRIGQ